MPNHNTHLIVKNAEGTSGLTTPDRRPWIDYWRAMTGNNRATCARLGCSNQVMVGAHVEFIDQRRSRNLYIVPLCSRCNNWRNREQMIIDSRTAVVEA